MSAYDGNGRLEYVDVDEHSDDGEDEGDIDDDNELHSSMSVDKFFMPSTSLVDSTRYCLMSMSGVAFPIQPAGLDFPDTSLQSISLFSDDELPFSFCSSCSSSSFSLDEDM